jgi:hypothetical protein
MDHKFTELIGAWLQTPADERDYNVGALYLLKLSGNAIMYRNNIAALDNRKEFIEYQLQKYYNFRVQELTHAQVVEMEAKVEEIVAEHLSTEADTNPETDVDTTSNDEKTSTEQSGEAEESQVRQKGKRADHDLLPEDIQAKYVENFSILQRMRELHLRLRTMSTEDSTCPDSERYPFLKELIELDKKLHANWEAYDRYVIPSDSAVSSDSTETASATKKSSKKKASTAK